MRWQHMGLALVAVMTVALCFLALTRDPDPGHVADPVATPTDAEAEASPSPSVDETIAIPDQRRADFAAGDALPEGSRLYDNGFNRPRLGIREGALRHGEPTRPLAIGSLEMELDAPVQKLGARIAFSNGNSGSVALVAWQSSLTDASQAGQPVPPSGLRLVVSPGLWQLTVFDNGEVVIAGDEYSIKPGPQTIEVFRQGDQAWVIDPSGARTEVTEARIARFAGPWASWQLLEETPQERPAAIEAVWAG